MAKSSVKFFVILATLCAATSVANSEDGTSAKAQETVISDKTGAKLPVENKTAKQAVEMTIELKKQMDEFVSDPGVVKINQESINRSTLTRKVTRTAEVPDSDSNNREVIKFRNLETPQKKVDQKSVRDSKEIQQEIDNHLKFQKTRRPTHDDNSVLRPEKKFRHDRRLNQYYGSQISAKFEQNYVTELDQKSVQNQDPKEIQQQIDNHLKLQQVRRLTRDDDSAPHPKKRSRHDRRLDQDNGSQINVKVERTAE